MFVYMVATLYDNGQRHERVCGGLPARAVPRANRIAGRRRRPFVQSTRDTLVGGALRPDQVRGTEANAPDAVTEGLAERAAVALLGGERAVAESPGRIVVFRRSDGAGKRVAREELRVADPGERASGEHAYARVQAGEPIGEGLIGRVAPVFGEHTAEILKEIGEG